MSRCHSRRKSNVLRLLVPSLSLQVPRMGHERCHRHWCPVLQHPEAVTHRYQPCAPVSSPLLGSSFLILREFYPFQVEGYAFLKKCVKWEVNSLTLCPLFLPVV